MKEDNTPASLSRGSSGQDGADDFIWNSDETNVLSSRNLETGEILFMTIITSLLNQRPLKRYATYGNKRTLEDSGWGCSPRKLSVVGRPG